MSHSPRPTPHSPTDLRHWANLFTRARLRKGWSTERLALEAEISPSTAELACRTGRCSSVTAIKLMWALGLQVHLPQPVLLTAQQAQRGAYP